MATIHQEIRRVLQAALVVMNDVHYQPRPAPCCGASSAVGVMLSIRPVDRYDVAFRDYAHIAERRAHGVGDVGRREVPVVLLNHAGVGVPELGSDDSQGGAGHDQPRRVTVPQLMKGQCFELGNLARGLDRRNEIDGMPLAGTEDSRRSFGQQVCPACLERTNFPLYASPGALVSSPPATSNGGSYPPASGRSGTHNLRKLGPIGKNRARIGAKS